MTTDQKFKGLNSRWFGSTKKGVSKEQGSSSHSIKRGTIITVEGFAAKRFFVMAVYSKNYNKRFMCDDSPFWNRDNKKHAPFRLSIRQLTYDFALNLYTFTEVTPLNTNTEVYQLISLSQVTSIIETL